MGANFPVTWHPNCLRSYFIAFGIILFTAAAPISIYFPFTLSTSRPIHILNPNRRRPDSICQISVRQHRIHRQRIRPGSNGEAHRYHHRVPRILGVSLHIPVSPNLTPINPSRSKLTAAPDVGGTAAPPDMPATSKPEPRLVCRPRPRIPKATMVGKQDALKEEREAEGSEAGVLLLGCGGGVEYDDHGEVG